MVNVVQSMVVVQKVNVVVSMDTVVPPKDIVPMDVNQNLVNAAKLLPLLPLPLPKQLLLFQLQLVENVVHLKVNVHLVNVVVNMVGVVKPMTTVEPVVNLNLVYVKEQQ